MVDYLYMNMTKKLFFALWLGFAGTLSAAAPVYYNTYAAWGDRSDAKHGHLYLYTGAAASTDYFLYATGVAGTTINNLVQTQTGMGPYQPVTAYPNQDVSPGFGNNYFKLSSTSPMSWEVDETTECHCGDAHGMVAAADNLNSYVGSIFMTFLRKDIDGETLTGVTANQFGDQLAVLSTAAGNITAKVSKWNGAAWVVVVAASPVIPAGGVWMWSPDQASPPLSGGTLAASAGHYKVELSGGQGLLYKGNVFSPMPFVGNGTNHGYSWNRDNALLVAPDRVTGKKIGLDLEGAMTANHSSAPQVIVSNEGAAPANFDLMRFVPTSPGAIDSQWPINGNDPSGVWTTVTSVSALAVGDRWTFASPNDGYHRVVSTNGQPLSAIMGTALTRSRYVGGDYVYAKDTTQAIGKDFEWWGHLQNTSSDLPLEVHVVAPWAGTQVTLNVTGATTGAQAPQVQTSTGSDQGLVFFVSSSADQDIHFILTSDQYVYTWFMSNTGLPTDGLAQRFGETFFSNPPMPQDLMVAAKSVAPGTATLGDTVTYYLTAGNIGAGNALSVSVWDTLPAGLTYVGSTPAPTTSAAPYFQWDLGTLAALSGVVVTVTAQVATGFNGEVKHNHSSVVSATAPSSQSSDAPLRILIPGADLQKSANVGTANVGDTITYTLTYFNSAAALPATPKLNLRVHGMNMDANSNDFDFEVTNNSASTIKISDLRICYWIYDSIPVGSISSTAYYAGGTAPWAGDGSPMSAIITAISPPIIRPDSRNANIQVCWTSASGNVLAPGSKWFDANLHLGNSWTPANQAGISYSRRPGGEAAYVEDSHFALYYQGNLVSEYTNAATADPSTAVEPQNWVQTWDSCPANVAYVGSAPVAALADVAPVLSWFAPNVPPQASAVYTWWGTVKAGTPMGTVINNRGIAQANTITALSNLATVVVPIIGTLTFTPTISPSPSQSATATPTATLTPVLTATPSATASASPTPPPTPTVTPTFTPLPTPVPTVPPLTLSLLPASPNPSNGDSLWIAWRLGTDATCNIAIYTIAGEKVRDLDPFPGKLGANEQYWDGRNSSGSIVSNGIFITHIKARSPAGEERDVWGKVAIIH